ncbi:MAG TPA: PP2C family protein-serine/threonine phosphatase [Solirubrobacteraceae bacterium]|nr:PP2C family protein-serine/threonine phosphatase [Solirubrobacteraceae bacterium]
MASRATQPPRATRAVRRAGVAIAAGCCVLGLGALPTAQAAKTTTTTSSATPAPVEAASASHSRRAERAAQAESAAPPPLTATPAAPPPVAEQPPGARVKHARAPGPPAPAPPAATGAARAGSGARSGAHARRNAQAVPAGEVLASQESQAAAVPSDESGSQVEALAKKQKKEKVKKEKVKKEKPSKEKVGKGAGGEEGQGSGSESGSGSTPSEAKGTGSSSSSQVAGSEIAVDASVSTSTPTPLGGTGDASITAVQPAAVAGLSGGSAQRATRSGRRHAKTNGAGGGARAAKSVAAGVTPALVASSPAAGPGAAAPTHKAAKTAPAATQPAIVRTFTHIVGVVPMPVRILIAALIALALALAVRSRFSSVRARRLMRQRGELLEDVGLLQAALLPQPPVRLGPVGTSVAYRPADGPGAGGDFYDVFGLDDGRLAVIVGDVSGHGREALPHTALVRFTVRAYLEAGLSPRKALQTAGSVLDRQLAGSFATVVAAIYHPRERTLTYASAGHPPPVVLGDDDAEGRTPVAVEPATACSAPPLGAGMRTGTRETVISVPGPARLCFHTDGVTEARVGQDLFGSERLTVALADLSREATAPALLDSVVQRTDARPDDMAACLLSVEDGSGQPAIVRELVELDGAAIASGRAERLLCESGMSAAAAVAAIDSARRALDRSDSVLLELTLGDGAPRAALERDNVVHTATLAAVSSAS